MIEFTDLDQLKLDLLEKWYNAKTQEVRNDIEKSNSARFGTQDEIAILYHIKNTTDTFNEFLEQVCANRELQNHTRYLRKKLNLELAPIGFDPYEMETGVDFDEPFVEILPVVDITSKEDPLGDLLEEEVVEDVIEEIAVPDDEAIEEIVNEEFEDLVIGEDVVEDVEEIIEEIVETEDELVEIPARAEDEEVVEEDFEEIALPTEDAEEVEEEDVEETAEEDVEEDEEVAETDTPITASMSSKAQEIVDKYKNGDIRSINDIEQKFWQSPRFYNAMVMAVRDRILDNYDKMTEHLTDDEKVDLGLKKAIEKKLEQATEQLEQYKAVALEQVEKIKEDIGGMVF